MTGYTHYLVENKLNLKDFIGLCARAFSPLIEYRDDKLSHILPNKIEEPTYHKDQIKEYAQELSDLLKISDEDRDKKYEDYIKSDRERILRDKQEHEEKIRILIGMLEQVREWKPPTEDHQGLKKFMIQQLDDSIEFEGRTSQYYDDELDRLNKLTLAQYWLQQFAHISDSINYHKKQHTKEMESYESKKKWLQDLQENLEQI